METREPRKKNWFIRNGSTIIIGWIILLFCIVYISEITPLWKNDNQATAGEFGDMFGAITAFVGSLSFLFLIYSINMQREELEIARSEYRLGLAEMKKQNDIGADQLKTNKLLQQSTRKQRIESTFFSLVQLLPMVMVQKLNDQRHIINRSFSEKEKNENERIKVFNLKEGIGYYQFNSDNLDFITERYNDIDKTIVPQNHYQIFYSILSFIKETKMSNESKQNLMNILISLIPQESLILIFYHFKLHKAHNGKFVSQELFDFANDHKLFDNLDYSFFVDPSYLNLFNVYRR